MSRENINSIIKELLEELKMKYPDFKGLYLFGSYARGSANEDSDIDIALVFDRKIDWKFKDSVLGIIFEKEIAHGIIIDSHLYRKKDLEEAATPIREHIITEGIFNEA